MPKAAGLPAFFDLGVFFLAKPALRIDLAAHRPADAVARLGPRPLLTMQSSGHTGANTIPVSPACARQRAGANDPNLQMRFAPGAGHCMAYADTNDECMARAPAFYDRYLR